MNKNRIALLSGARGQDAAWLSRYLLEQDWDVYSFERHVQSPDYTNIKEIIDHPKFHLEKGDVTDAGSVSRLVSIIKPNHFYHLAANSFVGCSWIEPAAVLNTNGLGTLNCLEAIRLHSPETKFLLASTSEVVGNSKDIIQNEETILTPHSPYAAAKGYAEYITKIYKHSHKLFACYTRCYNHESKFRGLEFVTRKSTSWIGKSWNIIDNHIDQWIKEGYISTEQAFNHGLELGIINKLKLGNLNSSRDWLDARDCVRGMHMVLNQDKPDNFVLASGKIRSISEFLDIAFNIIGINNWQPFIGQDPKYIRPDDVVTLCGNYNKAKKILGWEPQISFEQMVNDMIQNDLNINAK